MVRAQVKSGVAIGVGLVLSIAQASRATANYSQGFDNNGSVPPGANGPANLINEGWIFRNQSAPGGSGTWHTGYNDWFPPHAGAGYLAVESSSTDFFGGDVSQWAILPPIANQQAGDVVTFYVRRFDSSNADRLQLRYSPGGGTGTGSGPDAVGDFTTVLADLNPIPLTGWTVVSASVPGGGRLAIRYYVNDACNFACFASYVGIDSLTVTQSPPPGPPLPGPGQTVHWTPSISPVVINSDTTVVAGGTLIVDPGVQVQVQGAATLYVLGTLRFDSGSSLSVASTANVQVHGLGEFLGTAVSPVALTGGVGGVFAKGIQVTTGGTVRFDYVQSDLPVYVTFDELVYGETTNTILIDHSTFTGDGDVRSRRGTLAIRNSAFTGPTIEAQEAYVLFDASTLNGSTFVTDRRKAAQTMYLNNLVATDVPGDAPFQLAGFDYFLGPDNTIAGNLYPVHLRGGGIASGSRLPPVGNANNVVHGGVGEALGRITFANVGLPYRIDFDPQFPTLGGVLTIEPGVTVKFAPQAELFLYVGGSLIADGRPDAPIVFERLDPAQSWYGLVFDLVASRPHLRDCVVRGAEFGVIASRTFVRMDGCTLEDNEVGANANSSPGTIVARKTRFVNNTVGVQTSAGAPPGFLSGNADLVGLTNPNAFEGNGVALQVLDPLNITGNAPHNWWDDASGPQHPTNPGGAGQVVTGNAIVVPFRTAAPDFAQTPPRVHLMQPSFLMEEGRRVILHWSVEDDGTIATQRILYSPHGENPALSVLIDGIPGNRRSIELTVPQSPPSSNLDSPVLRVVAVDDSGQEGWDEAIFATPYIDFEETVTPDPIVGEFRPGEVVDVCYTFSGGNGGTVDAYLFLDAEAWAVSLGGAHTGVTCLSLGLTMPPVSTDLARVGVRFNAGAGGRYRWEFTDYFTIRPDPALGDAPPAVQLLSPRAGQSFPGGSVVPIAWTASDDEGLRSFAIQATYDGGRTWHTVAPDLPGGATAFDWELPASAGIDACGVRVVATDLRFQTTSAASGTFSVTPGVPLEPGDIDGDGDVDGQDRALFVAVLLGAETNPQFVARSDLNGDGAADGADAQDFVNALLGS